MNGYYSSTNFRQIIAEMTANHKSIVKMHIYQGKVVWSVINCREISCKTKRANVYKQNKEDSQIQKNKCGKKDLKVKFSFKVAARDIWLFGIQFKSLVEANMPNFRLVSSYRNWLKRLFKVLLEIAAMK